MDQRANGDGYQKTDVSRSGEHHRSLQLLSADVCQLHARNLLHGLGNHADLHNARLPKRVDHSSHCSPRHPPIRSYEYRLARLASELLLNLRPQFMNIDRIVSKVESLSLVDADDQALLRNL